MNLSEPPSAAPPLRMQSLRWFIALSVVASLIAGAYQILQPFISSIAWASILCFVTWPVYRQLHHRLGRRPTLAAFSMTAALLFAVVVPVALASWLLSQELSSTVQKIESMAKSPPALPEWVQGLPILGPRAERWRLEFLEDPKMLQNLLEQYGGQLRAVAVDAASRVGRNLVKIALTLVTAFFFYRHGVELLSQVRAVAHQFTGQKTQPWAHLVGGTIRAVVYGLMLTALAQGVLAGLGYWVAGVPAPVLLCAITCFMALIPFGAPLIWGPAGIWLLMNGHSVQGIGLLIWGALVVSTIDNVLRPFFISGATQIPYLLVFFGVLGGLGSFGLVGVFIGPLILAVLLALWRKWASDSMNLEEMERRSHEN